MNWDEYFLRLCYLIAEKSKDPSTKVGAVIVYPDNGIYSTGFNGFSRNVIENGERLEKRELKYKLIVHAEVNAIYNAARHGHSTNNCKIYVPWHPCSNCSNAIVQAGIKEVIMDADFDENNDLTKRWEEEHNIAKIIFKEANIIVRKS